MQAVYSRCCGLDVHKDQVTACVLVLGEEGQREVRIKEFANYWKDLRRLKMWLCAGKVKQVAMESTGVNWKPVWHVLEGVFGLLLANPYHMHNIPGRKTDQTDIRLVKGIGLFEFSGPTPEEMRLPHLVQQCATAKSQAGRSL